LGIDVVFCFRNGFLNGQIDSVFWARIHKLTANKIFMFWFFKNFTNQMRSRFTYSHCAGHMLPAVKAHIVNPLSPTAPWNFELIFSCIRNTKRKTNTAQKKWQNAIFTF